MAFFPLISEIVLSCLIISEFAYCFHRDIYYNNTQLFGSQKTVDSIVDDISCMLKVPRRSLHVVSEYVNGSDSVHLCTDIETL